jgi:sugar-specific transcriptional regulator TrmB
MIVKEDFLNKIRHFFGLNQYEAKIWTALLSRGISTAGELSDIGNVPRSRAYDILETLEKKGFVVMKLGKPIKYIAVEPKEVIERVKKLIRRDAEDNAKKLEDLKDTELLGELNVLHKTGIEFVEPTDLSGAIRGRNNLYDHLDLMLKGAEKTVTIMTTAKGVIRDYDILRETIAKLDKRKVKVRIAAPLTKECGPAVKELSKIAEIRHVDKLAARFCIVDGKELMFMVAHDEDIHPSYDIGIWINTPYFSQALEGLFELAWKDFEPASKFIK